MELSEEEKNAIKELNNTDGEITIELKGFDWEGFKEAVGFEKMDEKLEKDEINVNILLKLLYKLKDKIHKLEKEIRLEYGTNKLILDYNQQLKEQLEQKENQIDALNCRNDKISRENFEYKNTLEKLQKKTILKEKIEDILNKYEYVEANEDSAVSLYAEIRKLLEGDKNE